MRLSELLLEGQVVTGFSAKDKPDALAKLLDVLTAQGRLTGPHREIVMDALVARERIASTGFENGVAMPHARVDLPGDVLAVLATSPAGVPFQSADGQPARLLVMLVIPTAQIQRGIKVLAAAARLLSYEEVRESLARARTPREALEIVRSQET